MNETYNLELLFANGEGKNRKITIRRPQENLTEAEVMPVMETIAGSEIFEDNGIDPYAAVKNARYVRTVIEDILDIEEA